MRPDLSRLSHYFVPTESGDFRLLRDSATSCTLTVENPTQTELVVLGNLVTAAKANGWVTGDIVIAEKGETIVPLRTSIDLAGPLVSGSVHGSAKLWTAIRHESGRVIVLSETPIRDDERGLIELDEHFDKVDPVDEPPPPVGAAVLLSMCPTCGSASGDQCQTMGPNPRPRSAHLARTKIVSNVPAIIPKAEVPMAAAAVRPPQRGCPAPTHCNRRASEVLSVFSTTAQMQTWNAEGRMRLVGSRTGRSYTLYHRDEAARLNLTHGLIENRTGDAVCCWDESIPAEEEALAIKLAVEHREGWLRRLPRSGALREMDGRHRETWRGGRRVIAVVGSTPFGQKDW